MKYYESPELRIIALMQEDVVCTSPINTFEDKEKGEDGVKDGFGNDFGI